MSERIASVDEFFATIQDRFVPAAAKGLDFVFQYHLTGDGGGDWHVVVKNQKLNVVKGAHANPDVSMTIAAADHVKVINGDMKGQVAFLTGKMKISGKKLLAQKFQKCVPVGPIKK